MAGEGPAAEAPPVTEPPPEAEPAEPARYIKDFEKTLDETHARLEQNILKQTVRFNDFFGDVKAENLRQAGYELRLRNAFRFEHGWDLKYGPSIRANFVLSKISERLRLAISGENEPGPAKQGLPKDPGNPGFDRTLPTAHFTNTELRYELLQTPTMNLFLGAGVRLVLPFEAFVRSRFQYTHHLSDISLMRVGETFFVKNTDLFGETTEFSLERLFGHYTILRWASAGTASKEIAGLEWGSELSLIRELSPLSAITLTGGVYGNSNAPALVGNYRLLTRYRRNFLRSWLFYELEPEISWPRNADGRYPATLAFIFRMEVVFQGTAAAKENTAGSPSPESPAQNGKRGEPIK